MGGWRLDEDRACFSGSNRLGEIAKFQFQIMSSVSSWKEEKGGVRIVWSNEKCLEKLLLNI